MFHSVGRIMGWAKNYRKRMILGFVCSFFRNMVYRGAGDAGGLGPGADDRERLGRE